MSFYSSIKISERTPDFSKVPGTVIAHVPASGKMYIGSPSICKLKDGTYLASHDLFGPGSTEHTSAVSHIYHSNDKGKTWVRIAEINDQFWSKLFVLRDTLYLMGTNCHHGNIVIRRSTDGGRTWTTPGNKNTGLLLEGEYHCAPTAPIEYKGRLWKAMEDANGPAEKWGTRYSAFMMSIPLEADLLKAENWTSSTLMPFDPNYLNGNFSGWIEGNALVDPQGGIVNVLRVADISTFSEKAAIVRISEDGKRSSFDPGKDFIPFPGGAKKFTIRFDPGSKKYWTLSNYVMPEDEIAANAQKKKLQAANVRNTLALCSSEDLRHWKVNRIILHEPDILKTGFQYVDWMIEGNDIVFVSRTAFDDGLGGAHQQHDANFLTFHRAEKFRKFTEETFDYTR